MKHQTQCCRTTTAPAPNCYTWSIYKRPFKNFFRGHRLVAQVYLPYFPVDRFSPLSTFWRGCTTVIDGYINISVTCHVSTVHAVITGTILVFCILPRRFCIHEKYNRVFFRRIKISWLRHPCIHFNTIFRFYFEEFYIRFCRVSCFNCMKNFMSIQCRMIGQWNPFSRRWCIIIRERMLCKFSGRRYRVSMCAILVKRW